MFYCYRLLEACDLLCSEVAVNAETAPFHITALPKHQVESILNRKVGVGRSMLADLS